jgi:hypothetical protein
MARSTALVLRPAFRPPAKPAVPWTTSDLFPICRQLRDLQVQRRYLIVSQSRADRSVEALIKDMLAAGRSDLAEAERRALFKMAKHIRERIEKAGPDWEPPDDPNGLWRRVQAYVLQSRDARSVADGFRESVESDMKKLARQLPVWKWVKGVRGVGELGLGVIVAEAGDLTIDGNFAGSYSTPAKVWKRLGLAVFAGRRQGNPGKSASTEDWIMHGFSPQRRAEIWAFLSDKMFLAQWRGARDEDGKNPAETDKLVAVPAHPIGPYGEVYGERKEWNLARGWAPAHADADARRIMSKRFLRDLWSQWNRQRETIAVVEPRSELSPAAD